MPSTRHEIIGGYSNLADQMERIAPSLSEEELGKTVYSGWTAKDVLCHLAADSQAGLFFISLAQTTRSELDPAFDLDRWNAARVAERREKPVSELLAELRAGYKASVHAVESASEELLAKPVPNFDEGGTWTLAEQVSGVSGHAIRHLHDIEKAIKD